MATTKAAKKAPSMEYEDKLFFESAMKNPKIKASIEKQMAAKKDAKKKTATKSKKK